MAHCPKTSLPTIVHRIVTEQYHLYKATMNESEQSITSMLCYRLEMQFAFRPKTYASQIYFQHSPL